MRLRVDARRVVSREADSEPVTIRLRVRSLTVNSDGSFGRRSFTDGLLDGIAAQLSESVGSTLRASGGVPAELPISVAPVSLKISAGLGFNSGRKIGESCARAVSAGLERKHAT